MSQSTVPLQNGSSFQNLTTATLAGAGTFTSSWIDISQYPEVDINVSGAPFNAQGTMTFEFSPDNGTTIPISVPIPVNDLTVFIPIPLRTILRYLRVKYTNGSVAQTAFRIDLTLHYQGAADLTRLPTQTIGPAEPVKVIRALVEASLIGERGFLGADREIFGSGIVASRITRMQANFANGIVNSRVTSTVSGGGSTAQSNGQATITTGTSTTAASKLQTNQSIVFQPGREVYAIFSTRFTTPTSANSEQRAGLYDANNGFFLGYHGLNFGFTVRTGGVDTFTALTATNGDPLDATFLSRYARGSVLEKFNPLNFNTWRIRYGWDASLQFFDLQSPDGLWMRVHSNRFPNLQTTPPIQNPALPFTMEATKTSADATSLVVGTISWDCGNVDDPWGSEVYDVKGREEIHFNSSVTGTASALNTLLYTVNSGRRFRLTDFSYSVLVKVGTSAEFQLIDTAGAGTTPIIYRVILGSSANSLQQGSQQWKSPPGFTSGVTIRTPVGLADVYSLNFDGYEESQ